MMIYFCPKNSLKSVFPLDILFTLFILRFCETTMRHSLAENEYELISFSGEKKRSFLIFVDKNEFCRKKIMR